MFFNSKKKIDLESRPPGLGQLDDDKWTIFQVQPCEKNGGSIKLTCPPMSPFGKPCINYTLSKHATKISWKDL